MALLAIVLVHSLAIVQVNLTQTDGWEGNVTSRVFTLALVGSCIHRDILPGRQTGGIVVTRRFRQTAITLVPELDSLPYIGVGVGSIRDVLVGEVVRCVETGLAANEHHKGVLLGTVLQVILGRPLFVLKPPLQLGSPRAIGHVVGVGQVEGDSVASVPALEHCGPALLAPPVGRLGASPNQLVVVGGGDSAVVVYIVLEGQLLAILCLGSEQFVLGHINNHLCSLGSQSPLLCIVLHRHQHSTVVVTPVGIGLITIVEGACYGQQHAGLHSQCSTFGGEAKVLLGTGLVHTRNSSINLIDNELNALLQCVTLNFQTCILALYRLPHNRNRAVLTQNPEVVHCTHKPCLGNHPIAVDLAQLGTFVNILQEDVTVADCLIEVLEVVYIGPSTSGLLGRNHTLQYYGNMPVERVVCVVVAKHIVVIVCRTCQLLGEVVVRVDTGKPLTSVGLVREHLVNRVQILGVLIKEVATSGCQNRTENQNIFYKFFHRQ